MVYDLEYRGDIRSREISLKVICILMVIKIMIPDELTGGMTIEKKRGIRALKYHLVHFVLLQLGFWT